MGTQRTSPSMTLQWLRAYDFDLYAFLELYILATCYILLYLNTEYREIE